MLSLQSTEADWSKDSASSDRSGGERLLGHEQVPLRGARREQKPLLNDKVNTQLLVLFNAEFDISFSFENHESSFVEPTFEEDESQERLSAAGNSALPLNVDGGLPRNGTCQPPSPVPPLSVVESILKRGEATVKNCFVFPFLPFAITVLLLLCNISQHGRQRRRCQNRDRSDCREVRSAHKCAGAPNKKI